MFRKMYVAAGAALLYALAAGMASGYSASATANMKRPASRIHPDEDQIAWIGSIMALGAVVGGVVAGYLCNKLGRKGTLLVSSLPFVGGWLLITYADHVALVYSGRLVTGACVGVIFVTTPPYLVEISTPDVRGLLGASFQLFVVIGVLLVNSLGAVLTWDWLSVPSAGAIIAAACALCFVPESPRWLMGHGEYDAAIRAVHFLQGDAVDAAAECLAIDEDLRSQPEGGGAFSWDDLRRREIWAPALLSFSLVFFQQTTGSNAVLFYTVDIFKAAGSSLDPNVSTVVIDAVLVAATALSSVLMDKAGRKTLLLVSSVGMAVGLCALGTYGCLGESDAAVKEHYSWVPLVSLVVYITMFSLGYGPIPWLMMAEMTTVKSRSVICGAATALCWLFVFIITKTFQALEFSIHDYGAYFLYAGFSALSCVFVIFFLPETKGKPTEDIQLLFTGRTTNETAKEKEAAVKYEEMS